MMTGSWCFTEILMSAKPCSSNSEHSHSADSTSASGVARPYLASSRLSSEPALTPILIGMPACPAARAMSGTASASSCDGTATRTIWQPVAVSSAICCSVAFTSAVTVVVIDWTETAAPPPTGTACFPLPTTIWRDLRRGASGSGGSCGRPRSTVMEMIASLHDMNRIEDVSRDEKQPEPDEQREDPDADRDQLPHVHQAGIGPAAQPGQPGPRPFVDHHGEVTAVQRQQRQQVERADED